MTEDRIRIYNRQGIGLADLRVTAERNLSINEEGEANFDISRLDPNCREDFLRFGNWLLIENSKFEAWVGMIDTPQIRQRRLWHVSAYTPERLFRKRNVPRQLKLSGSAGTIFSELVNLVNRGEGTILSIGDIWTGGRQFPAENLSGDTLADCLDALVERSGGEYSFTPVAYRGTLRIYANWHERIGIESNYPLEESWNISDEASAVRIQGAIENELWGYGNGASQTDRPTATYRDDESAGRYGLMQGSRVYSDYQSTDGVLKAIQAEINTTKQPEYIYAFSILDEGATFENVRTGNEHPLRMWSFGIETHVRVMGWYYNPQSGRVNIKTMEVFDDSTG